MIRLLAITLLLVVASSYAEDLSLKEEAFGKENPLEPKWEEFCPKGYCNLQIKTGKVWTAKGHARQYWAERKPAFDKEIELCRNTTADKAMCYMQVRQIETNKNEQRRNRVQSASNAAYIRSAVYTFK